MISVKNLCKSYDGLQILKDVNIDFPDGSTTVIIGGSGCGKSTLLRMIAGLISISEGKIEIDGKRQSAPYRHGLPFAFSEQG